MKRFGKTLVIQHSTASDDHAEKIWEGLFGGLVERDRLESNHRKATLLHRLFDARGDFVNFGPVFGAIFEFSGIELGKGRGQVPETNVREGGVEYLIQNKFFGRRKI